MNCGPRRNVPAEYPVKALNGINETQKIMFLKILHIKRLIVFKAKDLPCQSINLRQSSNLVIEKSLIDDGILVSGASMPKLIWACKSMEISLDPSPIAAVIGFSKIGCCWTKFTRSLLFLGTHL